MTTATEPRTANDSGQVPPQWIDHLRHMLGATEHKRKSSWGYRNQFCAEINYTDHVTMLEMVAAGLVTPGRIINQGKDMYFHATIAGCEAIGLSKAAIKRAFDD